jgi:glutamate N-acetyltransferase/amino-acid N-acetyltransferase
MNSKYEIIPSGSATSPQEFLAGAASAGIKVDNKPDIAILYSKKPCVAAGIFTTNSIKASPLILTQRHLKNKSAQALVVNSGCANACTGESGMSDAVEMAQLAADKLHISVDDVLVASTGVIGVPMPMKKVRSGIANISLSKNGGSDLARAIMTTDTYTKEIAFMVKDGNYEFTIAGVAKGAGMIHPNMATMFCFITTDACIDSDFLQSTLQQAADVSFNMITIDGDTSPSDMVIALANGTAGNGKIDNSSGKAFTEAFTNICIHLAKSIVRDGEGATKLIEVFVHGAYNQHEARLAARTISGSPLCKAAIHGNDPNWGRIVAALGRSGAQINEEILELYINDVCVFKQGKPANYDLNQLVASLTGDGAEVYIRLHLNLGDFQATSWGCDLSEEYVTINSAYTT